MAIEKQKDNLQYSADSISSLKGADPYRQRPATVLGTDDISGVLHAEMEVIDNSADEAREGFSSKVVVRVWRDGSIEIEDFGRGVPMGWNEKEQKYAYELIFCTMYASGKYDDSNYTKSTGLNGIGDTAAQFTSEYMDVVSVRNEKVNIRTNKKGEEIYDIERVRYEVHFKKGYQVGELSIQRGVDIPTGTRIKFKPDLEVFKGANTVAIPPEVYIDKLRKKAMLLSNVRFDIEYEGYEPISICFEDGISDYIDMVCKKPFSKDTIKLNGDGIGRDDEENLTPEYKAWYNIEFTFSRETPVIEVYHNGAELTQGGSSLDGFKSAIVKVIDDYAKENGKINKNEKIQLKDVEDLIVAIISTDCPGHLTSYMHQTKVAINNKFIRRLVQNQVIETFKKWANRNKPDMDKIVQEVLLNKQAREKADAVKRNVIRELSKGIDGFRNAPNKLERCKSKNPDECEIYIVEGDSAKGPCVLARDSDTQAVLPLRGKTLNCMKETLERILSSEIIRTIIQSLGCGIELQSKYLRDLPAFDIKKLNFGKIMICTDADDDGYHIRVLVITMIYRLMPTLLKEGRVYIVETPLFMFTYTQNKQKMYKYAYNNKEKDKISKELEEAGVKKNNIVIKRLKGLGETNAEVMNETTMDKENRRIIQIQYKDNDNDFDVLMQSLMGTDVESRKGLIDAYYEEDFGDIDYDGVEDVGEETMEYSFY